MRHEYTEMYEHVGIEPDAGNQVPLFFLRHARRSIRTADCTQKERTTFVLGQNGIKPNTYRVFDENL
jgi:hypothetical protein